MKTQLVMLDTPIIVSDEEIKNEEPCLVDGGLGRIGVDEFYSNVKYSVKPKKIIAGIEGLPSINWNGLEGEFGWINIEKLAKRQWRNVHRTGVLGFIEGFKKAQSLNEKKYSLEDIQNAISFGVNTKYTSLSIKGIQTESKKFIQSLQQPKVFDIEVEMEDYKPNGYSAPYKLKPKITNNSIKILRKL